MKLTGDVVALGAAMVVGGVPAAVGLFSGDSGCLGSAPKVHTDGQSQSRNRAIGRKQDFVRQSAPDSADNKYCKSWSGSHTAQGTPDDLCRELNLARASFLEAIPRKVPQIRQHRRIHPTYFIQCAAIRTVTEWVVLLHGSPGDCSDFDRLADSLTRRGCWVFAAPDAPGIRKVGT